MQFLSKNPQSDLIGKRLAYSSPKDRGVLRAQLLAEQKGFCAYSERFIQETDKHDIEHFYPKNEYPEKEDDYFNLYVVLSWVNEHKPKKIKPFLPILEPSSPTIYDKIKYDKGLFVVVNEGDKEADNFIKFLGLNKIELFTDRQNHVQRIKSLKSLCGEDKEIFLQMLQSDKLNLSFITALEVELNMNLNLNGLL
ncbi:MAG: hypothetical protein MUE81_09915 [Thermoflexibacter sp.]|jgi:hypothetical protein|nr:hypothetical protein [Thermoflexibacter sp.]